MTTFRHIFAIICLAVPSVFILGSMLWIWASVLKSIMPRTWKGWAYLVWCCLMSAMLYWGMCEFGAWHPLN